MSVITVDFVKSAAVKFLRAKLDDTGMSQTELAKLAGLERVWLGGLSGSA